MAIASINPATGGLTKRFDPHTDGEIESALGRAVSAFEKHRRSSFAERAAKLRHAAEVLEKDCEHFVRIITNEMGKLCADQSTKLRNAYAVAVSMRNTARNF